MSSVIVLSSSPLRTFARSPTRVDFSSPHKGSQQNNKSSSRDNDTSFSASDQRRDGFTSNFTTAREVLTSRSTAENLPLKSSNSSKYKLTPPREGSPDKGKELVVASNASTEAPKQVSTGAKDTSSRPALDEEPTNRTVIQILPGDSNKKKRAAHTESLNLQRAAATRRQWTPVKSRSQDIVPESSVSGFGLDLATSFGHSSTDVGSCKASVIGGMVPTKRRKLNVQLGHPKLTAQASTKGLAKKATVRAKSPVKKGLTITGLVTSHYADSSKEEMTPMMQYLVSTQAMMDTEVDPDTFETNVKKTSKSYKPRTKSRLRSPGTAMRSFESQEVIFATASQLAREDSPTLLRDTVEAMKQSEEHYFSSPLRSQQTAAFSVQSVTPQKIGLVRFRGRKSLWNAGDRDEHNALLHTGNDVEDFGLKEAFAGADALIEPVPPVFDQEKEDSMNLLAKLQPETSLFDIDDLPDSPLSPSHSHALLQQRREYSTSVRHELSKRTTGDSHHFSIKEVSPNKAPSVSTSVDKTSSVVSPKPNYATWGDDELKEACRLHGIKRLRARKSMIDKLDERWAEHHGIDVKIVKAATKRASVSTKTLQPGDFLGKVHDLAARSVPKMRKPSKKKAVKPNLEGLTRRSSLAISDDDVQAHISDMNTLDHITRPTAFDRIADIEIFADDNEPELFVEPLEASTAPTKGTGVKAATRKGRKHKAKIASNDQVRRPLTPPPTMPAPTQNSSPGFEDSNIRKKQRRKVAPTSPVATQGDDYHGVSYPDGSLKNQIRKALIENKNDDSLRNHYEQPTFYEKIQIYDPIVLEEFTAWLNTEGFNAIGEDREINANEVRDWCHENGICCLWNGGWRANKKKGKIEE